MYFHIRYIKQGKKYNTYHINGVTMLGFWRARGDFLKNFPETQKTDTLDWINGENLQNFEDKRHEIWYFDVIPSFKCRIFSSFSSTWNWIFAWRNSLEKVFGLFYISRQLSISTILRHWYIYQPINNIHLQKYFLEQIGMWQVIYEPVTLSTYLSRWGKLIIFNEYLIQLVMQLSHLTRIHIRQCLCEF